MKRYEVRAEDGHGDMGILVSRHWFAWAAQRRLARAEAHRKAQREQRGWTEIWHYYIREV